MFNYLLGKLDSWLTTSVRVIGLLLLLVILTFGYGFERSQAASTLYLDLSKLSNYDFGIKGFRLTPVEAAKLRRLIAARVEQDFAGYKLQVTTETPRNLQAKVLEFLPPDEAGFLNGAMGRSAGFWTDKGYIALDLSELKHVAQTYALQIVKVRHLNDTTARERDALIEARLRQIGSLLGAVASHEAAHSYGVIGHYGNQLMAASPRLEHGFDQLTRMILALSLRLA